MERRSSTARPRRYDNAQQADHQPSDGVASALPGTAPRRGVICRYPPCGRRGPELPLRGSPVISSGIYRLDDPHQLLGRHRLHPLAQVLRLGSQPTVLAMDREAQDPVVAELRLELVPVRLEARNRATSGLRGVAARDLLRRLLPGDLLGYGTRQQRDRAATEAWLDARLHAGIARRTEAAQGG